MTRPVLLRFLAEDKQLRAAFDRLQRDAAKTQGILAGLSSGLTNFGSSAKNVGRRLTTSVTLPVIGIGAAVFKTAADFEKGMNKVKAVSGATGKDFERLQRQAKELGRTTQFSASQAADAMGFLAMAGFEVNDIIGAMPGTLQLAAAGALDLGEAADIASNVLTGYGMKTSELVRVNDVLAKTFTSTNTNLSQLGEAMKYAAPVASTAGVQFEEAAAALGLMGNAGIQASMAGTSLRGAISRLLNPTGAAKDAIAALGLKVTDSEGKLLPLVDIVRQLEESGADTADMLTIFGQRAGPALSALVDQGADALGDLTTDLENAGGTAENIAKTQMEGATGAMHRFKSAVEGVAIAIAESGMLDWITDILEGAANLATSLAETNPEVLKFGTVVVAAAAALGPVIWMVGNLASAFGFLLSPVGLVVVAIAGLVAAFIYAYNNSETFREKVDAVVAWLRDEALPRVIAFAEGVVEFFGDVKDWVEENWPKIQAAIEDVVAWLEEWVLPLVEEVVGGIKELWADLEEFTKEVWPAIQGAIELVVGIIAGIIDRFIAIVSAAWRAFGDDLFRIVKTIWNGIVETISNLLQIISGVIRTVVGIITGDWKMAWEGIKDFFGGIWDQIGNIASTAIGILKSALAGFVSAAGVILQGLKNAFAAPINWVVRNVINKFLGAIESVAGALSFDLNLPRVPEIGVEPARSFAQNPDGTFIGGFYHSGGIVGKDAQTRRFGRLRPDEEMAVLLKGERVLTREEAAWYEKNQPDAIRHVGGFLGGAFDWVKDRASDVLSLGRKAIAQTAKPVVNGALALMDATIGQFGTPGQFTAAGARKLANVVLDWIAGTDSEIEKALPQFGDVVELGKWIQSKGFHVSEHPAFGGVRGKHAPRSYHYSGRALDVNYYPARFEPQRLDALRDELLATGTAFKELLWRTKGHYNHMHVALAEGGIVTGPTRALIGEAGPEAVIPLSKLGSGGFGGTSTGGIDDAHLLAILIDSLQQGLIQELNDSLREFREVADPATESGLAFVALLKNLFEMETKLVEVLAVHLEKLDELEPAQAQMQETMTASIGITKNLANKVHHLAYVVTVYRAKLLEIPKLILTEVRTVYTSVGSPPPGRASGGPVFAGQAYLVGERGPELFVPHGSGSIKPAEVTRQGGPGRQVVIEEGAIQVHAPGARKEDVKEAIDEAFDELVDRLRSQ